MIRIVLLLFGVCSIAAVAAGPAAGVDFFEKKIRPVLAENCYECHNSIDKKKGGLALDYKSALDAGGNSGATVVRGKPDVSTLIQSIRHEIEDMEMPSKKPKLSDDVIADFVAWVKMGAPDPRLEKPTKEDLEKQVDWSSTMERRSTWWSFLPPERTDAPTVSDAEWSNSEIDRFLYDRIKGEGLTPEALASPETLVRRLHLVLIGLPPSVDVVQAFRRDPSQAAYEALVDTLMASHQYAERWGRYWLDWYRYAESHGSEGDPAIPYVKSYRSYVVRAIHQDVPYDQLIKEHLAGDLLAKPRINETMGLNESAVGPAQFRLVPHGFGVTDAYAEQIAFTDNQVDVVTKAMLGQTVSCARCHNHKFDPISHNDYHKFYGMMISSRAAVVHADSPERQEISRAEIKGIKATLQGQLKMHWLAQANQAIERLAGVDFDAMVEQGKVEGKTPEKKRAADVPKAVKGHLKQLPNLVLDGLHPLSAWILLQGKGKKSIAERMAQWAKEVDERQARNRNAIKEATYYADLRDDATYRAWVKSGMGVPKHVNPAGSFAIAWSGDDALIGIYPRGIYSHLISTKLGGAVSSPFHNAKGKQALVRTQGSNAAVRLSVRNYPLSHDGLHPAPALKPTDGWVRMKKYDYWKGEQTFVEVCTNAERTTKPKGGRGWFGLTEVYAGDNPLEKIGAGIVRLPGAVEAVRDQASLREFYRESLKKAIADWGTDRMTDVQAELLQSFVSYGFLDNRLEALPQSVQGSVATFRKLDAAIPEPIRVPGVMEGVVYDQPLLLRGDYKKEADPVPRGFLDVFGGGAYSNADSGRLALAEDMVSEKNTLLARVAVNRLWHHVFGRGIVASTDNFGRLGKKPTHPELLDNLAIEFRQGWSMKQMVRRMVTSRAFRSASIADEASFARDPENLYLSRFTPRRLDAEAILDSINAVAGRLKIDPETQTEGRALYVPTRRNSLHPFLTTFNLPIPTTTVGVRNSTDVPAQALTLMNGPETLNAAKQWSTRIDRDRSLETSAEKVRQLFLEAYARDPSAQEIEACLNYLNGKHIDAEMPKLLQEQASLREQLAVAESAKNAITRPMRERLLAALAEGEAEKVSGPDLKPIAAWRFEGGLTDSIGGLSGKLLGNARVEGGALVLDGGCFLSDALKADLQAKTMEVVLSLADLEQRGGGAMTVQNLSGDVFDSVVFAEAKAKCWIMGSDHFSRTIPVDVPEESAVVSEPVRIVISQGKTGRVLVYRNGTPYGKPYRKDASVAYRAGQSRVALGVRHGNSPRAGRMLKGKIYEARLYDRALTADEVAALGDGVGAAPYVVSQSQVLAALSPADRQHLNSLANQIAELKEELTAVDTKLSDRQGREPNRGMFSIAHGVLNTKEFIYVH